ncbi:hypothetical protein PRECH8_26300 [Insulibacter thermoxylanivorax]|uniref:Uncharacterized protein n=1 Tax=Insulibacter thermoxylanivorax TaxID=2749268 RepID=A0A916VH27_9BACL|nr:hypothetical protein PRECH8_26300 [Insulibacter thermoxylanivorax]
MSAVSEIDGEKITHGAMLVAVILLLIFGSGRFAKRAIAP